MTGLKYIPIKAGLPKFHNFRPSIEKTGKGNLLCYDAYGGRWFRCSEKAVREAVDFFIEEYYKGEILNYNDLYALWGISQGTFGHQYGYSPEEGYQVEMSFEIYYLNEQQTKNCVDLGLTWGAIDEPVLIIEPDPNSLPFEAYWEV